MAPTPKATAPGEAPPAGRGDRTSAVVTATLILLTALGIVTIFWEPLTALAVGAPADEAVSGTRGAPADGGAAASPSTAAAPGAPADASGSS
jgi:hypothetical protein